MTVGSRHRQNGFTLIEIIVTMVAVSFFLVILLTLFSDSLIQSSTPLRWLLQSSDLNNVMANITADYAPYPKWKASTSYLAGDRILPVGMNGRFYVCMAATGTSGASEPLWRDYGETKDGTDTYWKAGTWAAGTPYAEGDLVIPTSPNGHFYRCTTAGTSGGTEPAWTKTGDAAITDGGVQWKRLLGWLKSEIGAPDATLKDNRYGKYYVLENRFVAYNDGTNQMETVASPENTLLVKIKSADGDMTLTTLFTAKEQ
jgi:prepilin-type N-terminal cleavage/methylation domain-containing protein